MKEKITIESIRLFEMKGFSETSIQDIVDAIGVTKGTFYYYFPSKEQLLMDIQLRYVDELLGEQAVILRNSKTCQEKLFDIVYMLISKIKTQGSSARIFFREMKHLSEDKLEQIIEKRDSFRLNIEKLITDGMRLGEFRSTINPTIVTFGILGAANWSYQWFHPEGTSSDREVAEIFVDLLLHGIRE